MIPIHAWALTDGSRWVLVDSDMPSEAEMQAKWKIEAQGGGAETLHGALAAIGVKPEKISMIVLTQRREQLEFPGVVEMQLVQRSIDDFVRILIALIRDGELEGEWRAKHDRYQSAAIFIGSVNQLLITWLLYRRPRSLMTAVPDLIERLLPLLEPVPPLNHAANGRG